MSFQDHVNNQVSNKPQTQTEEMKLQKDIESTNETPQKTNSGIEPLLDEEESKKTTETLMQNVNPNKLKELIAAHVGGGPFSDAIIERKKYSFDVLKNWDSNKCELLMNHKNILESFVKKIEKKQEFLKNAMANVMKFFTQKVSQETEYISYYVKKIPKMFPTYQESLPKKKEYQDLSSQPVLKENLDHFPQFTKCFDEIDQLLLAKQKKIEAYKVAIEKDILKDLLMQENTEYEKASQELRDEIIGLRKKLVKANNNTAEYSTKHAKLFTEMLEPSSKFQLENKDLYNSEISLLGSSEEQIMLHKALGKEIMKFWQKLGKMEITRMKVIQKAFQEFLVKSEEYFGASVEYNNIRSLFVNVEFEKDLDKFLDLENCFSGILN